MPSSLDMLLVAGNSNPLFAKELSDHLDLPLSNALVGQFSDGETRVELYDNIRGRDIFLVQSTAAPANHHIMEALIICDSLKRASAKTITLVVPYFGYARQERKSSSRTPITARLVADLFESAGIQRVLTLELHNSAIQGFFSIPVDHLFVKPVFSAALKNKGYDLVISPDAGGVERARALAKQLNCGLAIIDKRRDRPNESKVMHIIGDVSGKKCLIVDDIVDTAGSLLHATDALLDNGATAVDAAITHAVLSGSAIDRISESRLNCLLVSNTIALSLKGQSCEKIEQISVAGLFADAIRRIHDKTSISSLFQ